MEKEELRKLIRSEKDDKILEALWELYELKFGQTHYTSYPYITTTTGTNPTYVTTPATTDSNTWNINEVTC